MLKNSRLASYLGFWHTLLFILIAVAVVFLVNWEMRRQALWEAEQRSKILLDRNLSTHTYFTTQLKPNLFRWTDSFKGSDYFDPSWMSSTYAVREINKIFHSFNHEPYYYKECAINSRSPEAEADEYEKEFLHELQNNPNLIRKTTIRYFDGNPYLVVLRKGETMESSCLRCHSTPDLAPKGMLAIYGSERSFNRKLGDIADVISMRIPLQAAYAEANKVSLDLSIALSLSLLLSSVALFALTQRKLLNPIEKIREKASLIANSAGHLGETIPVPPGRDMAEMAQAFNTMSINLRKGRDELESKIELVNLKRKISNWSKK
ncbi:MAG: c-type heme family protein [Desulfomonilaceae bacterium]